LELHSERLEVGEYSVHYLTGGEGPAVLFVHGWLESSWCWKRITDLFPSRSRVFAVDLLGFGETTVPEEETPFDIFHNTDVVEALIRERIQEPVHLISHSMGGMVALLIATRFPELVQSLTLISAPIDGPHSVSQVLQLAALPIVRDSTYRLLRSRGLTRLLANFFVHKVAVPERMIAEAQRVSHAAIFGSAHSIIQNNLEPYLRNVRVPTLVLFGDKDRVIDMSQGALAADRIRDVEFRILRNCGHCPNIEEPDKVSALLLRFMADVPDIPDIPASARAVGQTY
jgi:pimeloyl-ACP methyl ester carboxylesterase